MQTFYTSKSDRVYKCLLADILSGEIPTGEKLGEEAIAKRLKASRTPVREAIQRLTQEGLIERIPRCGCFVKKQDRDQIAEVFECRQLLECQALDDGFEAISEKQLEPVQKLVAKFAEIPQKKLFEFSMQLDDLLHALIVEICSNKVMKQIILNLQQQSNALRVYRSMNDKEIASITKERIKLIQTIIDRNKKQAVELLRMHIRMPAIKE